MIRRPSGLPGTGRGDEVVEFVLILPVFLLVAAAVVDFSLLLARCQVVTRAAREGARVAAAVIEPPPVTGDTIEATAVEHATDLLTAADLPCGTNCSVTSEWAVISGSSFVRELVVYPHEPFLGLIPDLFGTSIRARFIMRTQQQ